MAKPKPVTKSKPVQEDPKHIKWHIPDLEANDGVELAVSFPPLAHWQDQTVNKDLEPILWDSD